MGLSIRAYARHRGVSHVAVKKAIDTGRITPLNDGTIDPDTADAQWSLNTLTTRKTERSTSGHTAPVISSQIQDTASPSLSTGNTSLLQARTVNEVLKAQLNKVELAHRKKELVDRAQAVAHIFKLARAERDAWLNWPARVSGQMASSLNVDAHTMHVVLETAVRNHLEELGQMQPQLD